MSAPPGPTLLLAAPYGAGLWSRVREKLGAVANLQVVDPGDEVSLDDAARRVLRTAPRRFHIAGLCMGGHLALAIYRLAPGRVAGIALINTSAAGDTKTQADIRRGRIEKLTFKASRRAAPDADYVANAVNWLLGPDGAACPEVVREAKTLLAETTLSRSLNQQKAMLARRDSRSDLASIRVPTLVVVGAVDRVSGASCALEIARAVPQAEFEIIKDCGHLSPIEKPDELAAAMIGWLRRPAPMDAMGDEHKEHT